MDLGRFHITSLFHCFKTVVIIVQVLCISVIVHFSVFSPTPRIERNTPTEQAPPPPRLAMGGVGSNSPVGTPLLSRLIPSLKLCMHEINRISTPYQQRKGNRVTKNLKLT